MSKRPVIKKKLLLIPERLLDQITKLAKKEHRTVNGEILDIIENALPTKEVFVQKVANRRNAIYQQLPPSDNAPKKKPRIEKVNIQDDIMSEEEVDDFLDNITID